MPPPDGELVRNEHVRYDDSMPIIAPRSRRERPAKPSLSRDGIIETAVALMREEGLERVTMRRLAAALDTGPSSLYVYVRNTAELHAAVLDELLGSVGLKAGVTSEGWDNVVVRVLGSLGDGAIPGHGGVTPYQAQLGIGFPGYIDQPSGDPIRGLG